MLQQRPATPSSAPAAAHLDPEERLAPIKVINVSLNTPTSETGNRRRLLIAAAAAIIIIGIAGIALANNNRDDDSLRQPPPCPPSHRPPTVAPPRETGFFEGAGQGSPSVTYTVPDGWENIGFGVSSGTRTSRGELGQR